MQGRLPGDAVRQRHLVIEANGKNGIKSGAATAEEGEASLTIRDIALTIAAPVNDAINAEQLLVIESGTLTISAGDDAIHCDLLLNIGAEGTDGPAITITAYSSRGDGFDSNGSLTISGGTVAVWTANTADNQPLDADGTITISGGTVLAAGGSSGMGMNLSASQACVTFGASGMGGFGGPGGQMPDGQFPGGDGQRPGSAENGQRPSMPGNGQPPAAPGSGS